MERFTLRDHTARKGGCDGSVRAFYRFKEPNSRRREVTASLRRWRSLASIVTQIRAVERFPRFAVPEG
jgi:hypothetical protein